MKLKQALEHFERIVELCYESENPRLIEVTESIYNDAIQAEDINDVINACSEIQVVMNEEDFLDSEQEYVDEIQEIIESLSE
jgi:aspartate/glutamate racemase